MQSLDKNNVMSREILIKDKKFTIKQIKENISKVFLLPNLGLSMR
jgi:hypothetical protein